MLVYVLTFRKPKGRVSYRVSNYAEGIKGDALFESLHKFSYGHSSDFKKAAAGLAVLSYLFFEMRGV